MIVSKDRKREEIGMSLRTDSDAKQLLASLSPAVLDSLADLIVTKLQAGEPLCLLPKQDVVGSNPITRSNEFSFFLNSLNSVRA